MNILRAERAVPAAAAILLALLVIAPLLELVRASFLDGFAAFAVLARARPWELLGRSAAISFLVTFLATLAGVPLGIVFARAALPFRRAWIALHALPLFLPPFLSALGAFYLVGRTGSPLLFSPAGVIVVLAICFTPIITALTALGVLGIDRSLEDAARISAGPLRVATRILIPAARPAITLGAIVVFALSIAELGVPMFLRVDVYPAAVFARLGGLDAAPSEAAALALPMIVAGMAFVVFERALVRTRVAGVFSSRPRDDKPLFSNRVALPFATVAASASTAPIFGLLLRARDVSLVDVFEWAGTAPLHGLAHALLAAAIITVLSIPLGHALARGRLTGAIADLIAVFAFLLPAAIHRGPGIVALGFAARYAFLGIRTFAASIAQSSPSLEDAARILGAGFIERTAKIVVPLHRRALGAAFLLSLVFGLRDLDSAILYYRPGGEPLTVRIFTLEANGPEAVVAGLSLLHIAITILILGTGWLILSWRMS